LNSLLRPIPWVASGYDSLDPVSPYTLARSDTQTLASGLSISILPMPDGSQLVAIREMDPDAKMMYLNMLKLLSYCLEQVRTVDYDIRSTGIWRPSCRYDSRLGVLVLALTCC
jgi:hypothetical protein